MPTISGGSRRNSLYNQTNRVISDYVGREIDLSKHRRPEAPVPAANLDGWHLELHHRRAAGWLQPSSPALPPREPPLRPGAPSRVPMFSPCPPMRPTANHPGLPQAAKNCAALITRIDGNVGRLMAELPLIELTNNVAIIFSSSAPPEKPFQHQPRFPKTQWRRSRKYGRRAQNRCP